MTIPDDHIDAPIMPGPPLTAAEKEAAAAALQAEEAARLRRDHERRSAARACGWDGQQGLDDFERQLEGRK
jgi:hypothetical protein